nr:hypothetical protein [Acidimicrobiia bacterium]
MTVAGDRPGDRSPATGPAPVGAIVIGLAGTVLVAMAAMDGAALLRRDGGPWPVPFPDVPSFGTDSPLPVAFAYFAGLVLLVRAWLGLRRARPAVGTTIAVAALWGLPLLFGPPIGSRDAYSYVAQGEIARSDLPAYDSAADDLPPGPVRDAVDPLWLEVPAPYGPA